MKKIIFVLVLLSLVGCAGVPAESNAGKPTPESIQAVRLPMGYIPNVQFAPFYVAAEKGYFREEGIEIEFDYKFETDGVALVGAGELPFAVVSGEQVLLARAQGLPVVYAMAWWNGYPVAIVSLEEEGIQSPADLRGKKVGIPVLFGASYVGYRALLNAASVAEEDIQLETIGYQQVEALVSGQVEAAVVYANNEPVQLQERGYDIRVIRVTDYVELASNGLLTSERTLADNPELVRAMIRAALRGIADTIADPEEAYSICRKYVENLGESDPVQKRVLLETIEFWKSETPGRSDPEAWRNMQDVLLSMTSLSEPLDLSKAFTNGFLP